MLIALLNHQGKVLSKEKLQNILYSWDEEINSNSIEVHISNLRKKLGKQYIKTIRGAGYYLVEDDN